MTYFGLFGETIRDDWAPLGLLGLGRLPLGRLLIHMGVSKNRGPQNQPHFILTLMIWTSIKGPQCMEPPKNDKALNPYMIRYQL